MGMAAALVRWPDEIDEVIRGDLTAAAAYIPERVEQCVFALVMWWCSAEMAKSMWSGQTERSGLESSP
jgi:hypothetical protein